MLPNDLREPADRRVDHIMLAEIRGPHSVDPSGIALFFEERINSPQPIKNISNKKNTVKFKNFTVFFIPKIFSNPAFLFWSDYSSPAF